MAPLSIDQKPGGKFGEIDGKAEGELVGKIDGELVGNNDGELVGRNEGDVGEEVGAPEILKAKYCQKMEILKRFRIIQ